MSEPRTRMNFFALAGLLATAHAYQLAPSSCPNCARLQSAPRAPCVVAVGVDQIQGAAAPPRRREAPSLAPSSKPAASGFAFGEDSLLDVVRALRNGELALLAEDGEDDTVISVVASAQDVTTEQVEFLMEHAARLHVALEPDDYGSVYASMRKIVLDNTDPAMPALSVSTKGVGRSPRNASHVAATARALVDASSRAPGHTLTCPGAVPLERCERGGVLRRAGATEASVELAKLAGLAPVGLHATLRVSGRQALDALAEAHGLSVSSTADLVAYKRRSEVLVERCGPPARMPTKFGEFVAHCYRSRVDGVEHIALIKADAPPYDEKPFGTDAASALVRVHSECCTGDVFGSLRCDCGPQLEAALAEIERDGHGVLLYLRGQEGRGIGLGAKIHAYSLQERGYDTVDANTAQGLPVDSREYGTGAQILADLGITQMRLISNNPKKFAGLAGYGLSIEARVPSHTAPNPENIEYLKTKVERMGHLGATGWVENQGLAAMMDPAWLKDGGGDGDDRYAVPPTST